MYNEPGPMNASFQYELALPKLYMLLLVGTILPVMFALLADILPLTAKLVSVPTLVMLGCAAVVNEPATVVNTPAAAPILPTFALAVTLKLANVPVLVIFGWAAVVNEPATVVNTPPVAPMLPTFALPETDTLANVPVLVILG